jgi:putative transposase
MTNYFVTNCNREYQTRNHSKFLLKCHLIFVVKYRKKLLKGKLKDDMKSIMILAQTPDFRIEVMESDIDHIHFLIDYDPVLSISMIVRHLKQVSSTEIWKLHEKYLKAQLWKHRTFWTKGYFVSSIGNASTDTISKYIDEQG